MKLLRWLSEYRVRHKMERRLRDLAADTACNAYAMKPMSQIPEMREPWIAEYIDDLAKRA